AGVVVLVAVALCGDDLVGEVGLDGLLGGVPALGQHGLAPVLDGAAGSGGVQAGDRVGDAVQEGGGLAHVGGRPDAQTPGVMDHELGPAVHRDLVAGLGDEAGGAGGQAVHAHGDVGGVVAQGVVDGHAIEHV